MFLEYLCRTDGFTINFKFEYGCINSARFWISQSRVDPFVDFITLNKGENV